MERRLSAILAMDVVGYSRLMGEDEAGTLATLKLHREGLIDPKSGQFRGRTVKLMGDGALMEFASAVDAVTFAVEVQCAMRQRNEDVPEDCQIVYRVGINIGDIIIEVDDIYGDGVNIAARLERLAEPGGICVARNVFEQVKNKVDLSFQDIGDQYLKNISETVRAYRVFVGNDDVGSAAVDIGEHLALPDRPSIAVLPFDNLSGDSEQQFFADGMAEDIITGLSRYRWFFVIARNSSFAYRGLSLDVRKVSRELGVRYVLEGSVRKAAQRVRVTAQLIDAVTGHHIWAERYDRKLGEIFDLQDDITGSIVAAIEPELAASERQRARRKNPKNLDAWTSYQRGLWHMYEDSAREAIDEARVLFENACVVDPRFSSAYAELAYTHIVDILQDRTDSREASLSDAIRAAKKAVSLDPNDPVARCVLGRVHGLQHAFDSAISELEAALSLNPSLDQAYYGLGHALLYSGRPNESIPPLQKAIRLNPKSPMLWAYFGLLGRAYFNLGLYDEAIEWFDKQIRQPVTNFSQFTSFLPYLHITAALGQLGRFEQAREMYSELKRQKPDFSAVTIQNTIGRNGPHSGAEKYTEGLHKAGLLE